MRDVIDELRDAYTTRAAVACETEALIDAATAQGQVLRRLHLRRRFAALGVIVVVVVGAASVAIAARSDREGLRVATTQSTTVTTGRSRSVPVATVSEFPDLGRLLHYLIGEVGRDAQNVDSARAEVVNTNASAFAESRGSRPFVPMPYVAIYVVQLTGTTFVCHDCFFVGTAPHGSSILIAWNPNTHGVTSTEMRGKPIDLSTLGHVYRIVLHDTHPASTAEVCTQADLDAPGLAMPAPQRITTAVVLSSPANYARLDPAPSAVPKVPAATAWAVLTRNLPVPARSAQLLLGYYGTNLGPPTMRHVLAWVVRIQHLAYTGITGGASFVRNGTPETTTTPPVCQFTNAYLALNATTGTGLIDSYGG